MKNVYLKRLILPVFILYTVLYVLPCAMGVWYSFTNWNLTNFDNPKFIGLENYFTIFVKERDMYLTPVWKTLEFAVITAIFETIFGIGLALLLNREIKGKGILRGIFFLPFIMAPLIIGYIFSSVYHPNGILNNFLSSIGLDSLTHSWIAEKQFAFPAVMFTEIWRYVGLNMVIFIAGLQMVPKSFYESASIDGSSTWKQFIYITVPFIIPSLTVNTVLNIIHGINVFDIIVSLTNGGPGNATTVLNTVIYDEFASGRYGLASTLGVVIMVLTAVIAFVVQVQLSKREVDHI